MLFRENRIAQGSANEKMVVEMLHAGQVCRSEICEAGQKVSREVDDPCLSPGSDSVVAWASGRCALLDEGRQGAGVYGYFQSQHHDQLGHCHPEVAEVSRPGVLQRPQK